MGTNYLLFESFVPTYGSAVLRGLGSVLIDKAAPNSIIRRRAYLWVLPCSMMCVDFYQSRNHPSCNTAVTGRNPCTLYLGPPTIYRVSYRKKKGRIYDRSMTRPTPTTRHSRLVYHSTNNSIEIPPSAGKDSSPNSPLAYHRPGSAGIDLPFPMHPVVVASKQ